MRVVENKYPALSSAQGSGRLEELGAFQRIEPGRGRHEVIVETPQHDLDLTALSNGEILEVLQTYRARFAAAVSDSHVEHLVIFRNQGPRAHASLEHPHSQLVGLPFIPPLVEEVLERSRRYRTERTDMLLLDMARAEIESGSRLVLATEQLAAFVPFAAAHEYEIWIVPRLAPTRFDRVDDPLLLDLARVLRRVLGALAETLEQPDYNYVLHTPPLRAGAEKLIPWYVQVIPRHAVSAGFEMGIGVRIVATPPEEAAGRIRSALDEVAAV